MGERHDLPKIKPDEKPSLLNIEAANFGFGASIVATLVASISEKGSNRIDPFRFNQKTSRLVLAATAAGALIGGLIGKSRQEKEQVSGKTVSTPSYFNEGIFAGWLASDTLAYAYDAVKTESKSLANISNKSLMLLFALPAGLMTLGSIMRKNSLQRDFDKAVAIRDANHAKTQQLLEAAIANQNNPPLREEEAVASFKNSVTPDESALLMEKQAQAAAPVTTKPEHGPEHKPQPDHTAHGDAHAPEHHAAHGEHHSEHHGEHHDAPSHAAKHEHQQHTGSHAAKHEPAASHTDHAQKHDTGMAMSA